ncbi:hypothetical protein P3T36_003898 [Kitasatospora sp. MAP12-15]|uniref:hypothetical protein n=1 Tax=unclassified Kitasatospora TaxID=2633591 RepID=UPI002477108B|nr:hypothetical protein [Kitasatospora sp. MAP12-44]MDH6108458.1 hypothetical protein [Kitasatospora sp. MAP12-44]
MKNTRSITAMALLLALAAVVTYLALGGSGGRSPSRAVGPQSPPPGSAAPGTGATGTSWIVSGSTLTRLLATDTTGSTTAKNFNTPNAYVLTGPDAWAVPAGWSSTPTASFTSYTALRSAFAKHSLDPRIRAVLYDNEHWSLTPADEQADPAHYDQLAAELVHRNHLLFIAAPAPDLVNKLSPDTTTDKFGAFLGLGVLGQAARYADVLDIQAQGAENNPTLFASFVSAATAQARQANPHVKVLAGISTNPSGTAVTAATIDSAARTVRTAIDGYWLNDPAASAACPACAGPYPQTALTALRNLS